MISKELKMLSELCTVTIELAKKSVLFRSWIASENTKSFNPQLRYDAQKGIKKALS